MSDIKQIQDFIQTTKMSKDEVFNLIMTLQNKEVSLDKSSQKTYALAVEEEDFLNKCSKNRGINPDTKRWSALIVAQLILLEMAVKKVEIDICVGIAKSPLEIP